jgi:hypothetical protein
MTAVPTFSYYCSFKPNTGPLGGTINDNQGFWRQKNLNIGSDGSLNFGGSQPNPQGYFGVNTPPNTILADQWYDVVITFQNSTLTLYLNGDIVSSSVTSYSTMDFSWVAAGNSTATTYFGAYHAINPGITGYFNGVIDDFGIWDKVLTPEEIASLHTGPNANPNLNCNPLPPNLQNGLIGYWPFCGNANDESGNGNNGDVYLANLTVDRFNNSNSAYSFNNGPDKITVANSSSLQLSNEFSISCWIKTLSNTYGTGNEYYNILSKWGNGGDASYQMAINPAGNLFFSTHNNFVSTEVVSETILNFDTWYHLFYEQNNNNGKLFINGELVGERQDMNIPMIMNNYVLFGSNEVPIGYYPSNLAFEGTIDDISFWNRVLTNDEIQQLYAQNSCNIIIYDTITSTITETIFDTVSVVETIFDTVMVTETVYDTVFVTETLFYTVFDTVTTYTTVTDTLIINTLITALMPPANTNTIKVFPNPAGSVLNIDYGNFMLMNEYQLVIENSLGQIMHQSNINQEIEILNLDSWNGNGLYFVRIIDPQGNTIDIRKIVLQ